MTDAENNKNSTSKQKQCNCCFQQIQISAKVCNHCGKDQRFLARHFGDTAIIVSIVMVIISVVQMVGAFKQNIDASHALNIANAAAAKANNDANEIARLRTQTVIQLQNIAYTIAKVNLTDLMAANFWDGTTLKTRLDLHDQIIANLKVLNVPDDKIGEADDMWAKGVGVIYHNAIRNALEGRTNHDQINIEASPELRKVSHEFQEMLNFEQWQVPCPNEMESFIKEKGFMNDTIKELICDYRHFLETGDIRRRSVFEKLR